MQELVKITQNDEGYPTVSGRDLHAALEIQKDYSDWVKAQIERSQLERGIDFEVFPQKGENPLGGRPSKEYVFSLDAAKHIAMMAGTEQGKYVRQYFIEVERQYRKNAPALTGAVLIQAAMVELQVMVQRQAEQLQIAAPKAEYFDTLVNRKLNLSFRDSAKELGIKERFFIDWLLARHYIYRDASEKLKPYADYTKSGSELFTIKEYNARYSEHTGNQTLVTVKGRETFRLLLQVDAEDENLPKLAGEIV